MNKLLLGIVFFCSVLCVATRAQNHYSSPFRAGVFAGLNLAQVDGDVQFGYNKKTLGIGLRGGIVLNKRLEIVTELLYNKRGAKPSTQELGNRRRQIYIDMHYAEVPLLLKLNLAKSPAGYYMWDVIIGASYGRLLNSKTQVTRNNYLTDTLQQNTISKRGYKTSDFSLVVGVTRYFSPKFGVGIRHTTSLNTFYYDPNMLPDKIATFAPSQKDGYLSFRHFFFSINAYYYLISPKIEQKKVKRASKIPQ